MPGMERWTNTSCSWCFLSFSRCTWIFIRFKGHSPASRTSLLDNIRDMLQTCIAILIKPNSKHTRTEFAVDYTRNNKKEGRWQW